MPLRYAGGVRLAPIRRLCGDPSAVVLDSIGDARLEGGDCGLCDGVEGTERAFMEVGEIFEAELFAMRTLGASFFDIFLEWEG